MKVKIILAIVWTSLCVCERQQRSTVLTDESKRILEHFDFSNFDKQEALNYLDRQRYENQIRGKRSHSKFKKGRNEESDNNLDSSNNLNKLQKKEALEFILIPRMFDGDKINQKMNQLYSSEFPEGGYDYQLIPEIITPAIRNRRGHRSKKKHRSKFRRDEEEEEENEKKMPRKRKKKRKKKRHYWDHWSEWSPCSVTCGRGRKIRWRKCLAKNCTIGELEMGEKTCQLPACNLLTKLLGL